jgi:hypothetical protein
MTMAMQALGSYSYELEPKQLENQRHFELL